MIISDDFKLKLKEANRIAIFSGAGMSAESGIPTFRGEGGIWNKLKPEELANFNAFMRNPQLVWEWYQFRRDIIDKCQPNPGHYAIAEMEKYFNKLSVITQNVDALHERAGSKIIHELHGNITKNYCLDCHTFYNKTNIKIENNKPTCEKCNGLVRPDVVWFGEALPQNVWNEAEKDANMCDICIIVGTSGVVYPAAYIPFYAKQNGAFVVDINVVPSELSSKADLFLQGKSGEVLPIILDEIKLLKEKIE